MDVIKSLRSQVQANAPITTIDMHTTGEPTRIIISGFPKLTGPLLVQRRDLMKHYDHLRKRVILEPRGHWDMYGALLVQDTELVTYGDADIGVLFMTNDGYSTMCGHATIALGRFLVDTHDLAVFPNREKLKYDAENQSVEIKLHAPCGVVTITCPTTRDGQASDPSRPVSFLSVPSFATALNHIIELPEELTWPGRKRDLVRVDFAYGGAFYALVKASDLGFSPGLNLRKRKDDEEEEMDIEALRTAANAIIKAADLNSDLRFLYGVIIIVDDGPVNPQEERFWESGLSICFFADSQIDRSPTGSGVQARVAAAYAKGTIRLGESRNFESIVSVHFHEGRFLGTPVEEVNNHFAANPTAAEAVRVRVEGWAKYTGTHAFVLEENDIISKEGFAIRKNGLSGLPRL
ncbi:Diaminopimelate epimerase-like protein [Rhizodiscina lignyota]|uniref:trans-L-3-hydroxyproline dehydratase n=1 Tax=Rhizodiscina lignyota TaxID=1504668 RepID=A0A9P4M989_9PEZI|nr:Diaminopimelate epimerase-like protein [Rhizodiscina lignyota]